MRSDEELMAAYVAGDAAAFDELFARYSPVLLRVMRQQLFRPGDAEDLVQQTFLQLHRSRKDFKAGHRLRPWLFTIALNLKREYFRRIKRRPEAGLPDDGRADPVEAPRGQHRVEASQTVRYALERLPEDQRDVIVLHWIAGLPLPDVAGVVGASLSAVKVRAHRGYAAMRRLLEDSDRNPDEP